MNSPDYLNLLDSALESLVPPGVAYAVAPMPEQPRFRFEAEAHWVRQASEKRQREFAAGRDCARAALSQVGLPEQAILADANGVPIWPEGALASLSHSRGYCAAVATDSKRLRMLGLDLEQTNRLSRSAMARVVHPSEEEAYVQDSQQRATLIFCAKEAFFKAQFPGWQTYGNFHDMQLAVEGGQSGSISVLTLGPRFPQELRSLASKIRFNFRYFEDFVVTVCWLDPAG